MADNAADEETVAVDAQKTPGNFLKRMKMFAGGLNTTIRIFEEEQFKNQVLYELGRAENAQVRSQKQKQEGYGLN